MATILSTFTEVLLADTRRNPGTIVLPPLSQIPYRMLTFKDVYGTFSNSTLTLSTQSGNTFEDNTTTVTLSNNYSFYSLYAASTKWVLMNGTQTLVQTISSLQVNSLQIGNGTGWVQLPPIQTTALSTNQIYAVNAQALTLSSLQLNVSSINGLQPITQANITSSIIGLGTAGYVSSSQLVSTTLGLQQFISTFIDPSELTSTVIGLGTAGFASSIGLQNTIGSTVIGLGTAGYISSPQLLSTSLGLQQFISSFIDPSELTSTVIGLGTAGFTSSLGLQTAITSSLVGLGTAGYISSSQLLSTSLGLQQFISSFIDPSELTSTVIGLGTAGFTSSLGLQTAITSSIVGLGSAGYISSSQLLSTSLGLQQFISSFIDPSELTSTVIGLGTAGFTSSLGLQTAITSSIVGLGSAGYISSSQLLSTSLGLQQFISSFIDPSELTSTVIGLGTAGFTSSLGLQTAITSSIVGLGTAGYVSTSQLISSINNLFIPYSTFSTNTFFQFRASSTQLFFGTNGSTSQIYFGDILAKAQISTISTPLILIEQQYMAVTSPGSNNFSYTGSDQTYTVPANVTSLRVSLSGAGGGSTSFGTGVGGRGGLVSGLLRVTPGQVLTIVVGQGGSQNGGTTYGGGGSAAGNCGSGGGRSAIRFGGVDIVVAGGGGGSGANGTTWNGGAGGGLVGGTADGDFAKGTGGTQSAGGTGGGATGTQPNGGNFAGVGGGGGGGWWGGGGANGYSGGGGGSSYVALLSQTFINTQGGGAAPQTNGSVIITYEKSYTYRPANVLEIRSFNESRFIVDPTLRTGINVMSINSNYYLDVSGTANFRDININGSTFGSFLASTATGLGTIGYISTPQLFSTSFGLFTQIQAAAASVTANQLVSTVVGLGSAGYVSSSQLLSTTSGLSNIYLTTPSLVSTVQGLGTVGYISSSQLLSTTASIPTSGNLASTVIGLGTAGYVSSTQLISSISGIYTFFPTTNNLVSTVQGLGTAGYLSSVNSTFTTLQIPYSTINISTVFQFRNTSTGIFFGSFGSTSQIYMGDILAILSNTTSSTPVLLLEQPAIPGGSVTVNYSYTGSDQTFVVPTGVTSMNVTLNGAGGGFGIFSSPGGAGGRVSGTLAVNPGETLTFVVGQAGSTNGSAGYGGGGASFGFGGGSGGGRTAIRRSGADIVTAAGGGGGGTYNPSPGGAGGGTSGNDGGGAFRGGFGGTQSAGGGNAGSPATNGSLGTGGTGTGGGGAGYYGGGGGNSGGGGGGSSLSANLTGTVVNTTGAGAATDTNGSMSITYTLPANYRPGNLFEIRNYTGSRFIVDPLLNVGINVSSINTNFKLDVNGAARFSSIVTENINFGPSFVRSTLTAGLTSTVIGLGSAGYISSPQLLSTSLGLSQQITTGAVNQQQLTSSIVGLGTAGYLSTAITVSTLTSTLNNLVIPYSTFNTNTYFQFRASSTELFYGYFGSTAQIFIGDIKSLYGDVTSAEPLINVTYPAISLQQSATQNFTFTGSDQSFVVPNGVRSINVTLNGAGGGRGNSGSGNGGNGGLVSGTLSVNPGETLTLIVGGGGNDGSTLTNAYGGGGKAGNVFGGGGGGRSAIRRSVTELVTAGGGGGNGVYQGGAGGGLTGGDGSTDAGNPNGGGKGGTQSAGGAAGTDGVNPGNPGTQFTGGDGIVRSTGGGGGGYYGGGSGGGNYGGGGGGSSYVANLTGTVVNTQGGGASGATSQGSGGNGSITISYSTDFNYRRANILEIYGADNRRFVIDPFTNTSIGFSTPINSTIRLDVNGVARVSSLITENVQFGPSYLVSTLTSTLQNNITSTTIGLGTAGYISSPQLLSTSLGLFQRITQSLAPAELTSSIIGLGTAGYISSSQLLSTSLGLQQFISTFIDPTELTSTVIGLGSAGYVSTSQLLSTSQGLQTQINAQIDPSELTSSIIGLGTAGYISSPQLLSTSLGLQQFISSFIDPAELTSTVIGLGTAGFTSTLGLQNTVTSTLIGLGTAGYISSSQLLSTSLGLQQFISSFIDTRELTSSIVGLGTAGYISSPQLLSTSFGLTSNISTTFSTLIQGLPTNFGGEVLYLNYSVTLGSYKQLANVTTTAATSSVPVNLNGGSSNILTSFKSDFALPAFIPNGLWDMSIWAFAEKPTDLFLWFDVYTLTGVTETLVVSGYSDRVQLSDVLSNTNITVAVPYTGLGSIDAIIVKMVGSNADLVTRTITTNYEGSNYSHIHTTFGTIVPASLLTSTVIGLGTAGYISSPQLLSTSLGLQRLISSFIDSSELTSTVNGLGTAGYLSTLNSTFQDLFVNGTASISSLLFSTTTNITIAPNPTNYWVAVGENSSPTGTIKVSSDSNGLVWNNITAGGFDTRGLCVAWNGFMWVAGGYDTNGNIVQYSYDGSNWSLGTAGGGTIEVNGVAWSGSLWMIVCTYSGSPARTIQSSTDGINWSFSLGTGFTTGGQGVAWNGRMWVAVGIDSTQANTIQYSYDGNNWYPCSGNGFTSGGYGVAWNGRMWVAVGQDSTQLNTIKYSYDGINWFNSKGIGFATQGYSVAWNGMMWIAVGNANGNVVQTVQYSYDGINWNQTNGQTFSGLSVLARGVGFNGTRTILVGSDGNGSNIKYTDNGISVNDITSGFFSVQGNGVAYSSNVIPTYLQENLQILPSKVPYSLNSNNTIYATLSTIQLNNTLIVDGEANFVGINNNSPNYELDVNGTINASRSFLSSLYINILPQNAPAWDSVSSFAGLDPQPAPLAVDIYGSARIIKNLYIGSTTTVIGTKGMIVNRLSTGMALLSTLFMGGTMYTPENFANFVSTPSLLSTSVGLFNLITSNTSDSQNSITSSIIGLGTLGYISSSQLLSTSDGLLNRINQDIDVNELTSTIIGLGTYGYVSTPQLLSTSFGLQQFTTTKIDASELTSTINGLGTVGYVSTSQLLSTSRGLQEFITTKIDTNELTSTINGLGTAGYISSSQLTSTTQGIFANIGSLSGAPPGTVSTVNFVGGIAFNNLSTNIISTTTVNALNMSSLFVNTSTTQLRQQVFIDLTTATIGQQMFQSSQTLYFGNNVLGPARVAPIQTITF